MRSDGAGDVLIAGVLMINLFLSRLVMTNPMDLTSRTLSYYEAMSPSSTVNCVCSCISFIDVSFT